MGDVLGQASFLFHISQQLVPVLEGKSVEKSKLRLGRFHFTFKIDEKCEMEVILE